MTDVELRVVDDARRGGRRADRRGSRRRAATSASPAARARARLRAAGILRADWGHVDLWWIDERCVPPADGRSNYRMIRESLLDGLARPPRIHRSRASSRRSPRPTSTTRALDGVDARPRRDGDRARRPHRFAVPERAGARGDRRRAVAAEAGHGAVRPARDDDPARSGRGADDALPRHRGGKGGRGEARVRRRAVTRRPASLVRGQRRSRCSTAPQPPLGHWTRAHRRGGPQPLELFGAPPARDARRPCDAGARAGPPATSKLTDRQTTVGRHARAPRAPGAPGRCRRPERPRGSLAGLERPEHRLDRLDVADHVLRRDHRERVADVARKVVADPDLSAWTRACVQSPSSEQASAAAYRPIGDSASAAPSPSAHRAASSAPAVAREHQRLDRADRPAPAPGRRIG